MIKKSILLLSALACFAGNVNAQRSVCGTDEVNREYLKQHPEIAQYQAQLEKEFRESMKKVDFSSIAKVYPYNPSKDSNYATVYIPVVIHIVHDYGTEYLKDQDIYDWINKMNVVYNKRNSDTADVISTFKPYIGNPRIQFYLAKKDPYGKPTTGITRRQSYLTRGGDDQAKFDIWAPERYLNIWIINYIGRGIAGGIVAAYSTFPASAAANPYSDGIIGQAASLTSSFTGKTYEHEIGHYLNLYHPWNNSGKEVSVECGDDEVDDTPPTTGHFGGGVAAHPNSGGNCNAANILYDSTCAQGYMKTFTKIVPGVGLVTDTADYPDTTNVQNIMDYSDCPIMFTHQQVDRMRSALKSTVANRDSLVTPFNLWATGLKDDNGNLVTAIPAITPVPDFSVEKGGGAERYFFQCADKQYTFKDRSWRNNSITGAEWTLSNEASSANPSTTGNGGTVVTTFGKPGWVDISIKTKSTTGGDSSITKKGIVYAADPNYVKNPMDGYFQEFTPESDLDKWPAFNYYNNNSKWEVINNNGFYDKSCIVYRGYDTRVYPGLYVGAQAAIRVASSGAVTYLTKDKDDFFTPAFDLSGMTSGVCNLNFMYSGAARTSDPGLMLDTFEIAYSTDCGANFTTFKKLYGSDIFNRGSYAGHYAPLWMGDWDLRSLDIPAAARTSKVYFRFRYLPSIDGASFGDIAIGNDFFIDRINISPFPLGMNTLVGGEHSIIVAPNPTNSSANVIIKDAQNSDVTVVVTDVTGKVVYRTQQVLQDKISRIEIPASAIAVKGMYMVQVVSGSETHSEKLISY
ncbi:MAG: T9SS type A sorting domain-containing protein [Bacteroidetes bacterium]|nr:T9SS type A sorting domain-containing protein [Bacteroidota bacterium]